MCCSAATTHSTATHVATNTAVIAADSIISLISAIILPPVSRLLPFLIDAESVLSFSINIKRVMLILRHHLKSA